MSSNAEHMRVYMLARYHRRRTSAIEQLGGVCVDCGTGEGGLVFDHIDPATKTARMSRILTSGSEARVQAELEKCELRCVPCHKIKTVANDDIRKGHARERGY